MLLRTKSVGMLVSVLGLLAACGQADGKPKQAAPVPSTQSVTDPLPEDEANAKVGSPYEVRGQSFSPSDNTQYDEVGYGSWYGGDSANAVTGNGEAFNPAAITAAHKTLPMPSFVEVTNLDTGKTILVRINDRGPFADGRIIDLSQGAAQQLGVEGQGTFPVRVRRVNPPEQEKDVLRSGGKAVERIDTPPSLLTALRKHLPAKTTTAAGATKRPEPARPRDDVTTPYPQPNTEVAPQPRGDRFVIEDASQRRTVVRPPSQPKERPSVQQHAIQSGHHFIQIASFSSVDRARALASKTGGSVRSAGRLHRVVTGPYASEEAARAALRSLSAKGYRDARIVR